MNKSWNLVHLEIFVTAYKIGSFVKAASELGISPAYVSKAISELEDALKAKLFRRTTRKIQITAEGDIAYRWAANLLEMADKLKEEVAASQQNLMGAVRISTSLRLGRNHISYILALLNERYPDLDIWLELVDRSVDLISEGVDIDFRVGNVEEPYMVPHRVVKAKRILCASPNYIKKNGAPVCIEDLVNHNCLPFRDRVQPYGVWHLEGPEGMRTVRVRGKIGSNHSDVARRWAAQGRGIILLSDWDVHSELQSGDLVQVLPQYFQSADITAVTQTRLSNSLKLKVCVEFIVENLRYGPYSLNTTVSE